MTGDRARLSLEQICRATYGKMKRVEKWTEQMKMGKNKREKEERVKRKKK